MLMFVMGSILALYIPGRNMGRRLGSKGLESLVVSLVIGIVLWALIGFGLGFLNLRWLSYGYIGANLWIWIKNFKTEKEIVKETITDLVNKKMLMGLVLVGAMVMVVAVVPSGIKRDGGRIFFNVNITDGTYHVALIKSLVKSVPPEEPGLAGSKVKNYHYLSHMVEAELARVFRVEPWAMFYLYMPVLVAVVYGLVGYVVAGELASERKNLAGLATTAFLMLGGGWGFVFGKVMWGEWGWDLNALDHAGLLLTNPPRAMAQVGLLVSLLALNKWVKTNNKYWGIVLAILCGSLVGFKVYVGIIAMMGLVSISGWWMIKKDWGRLWVVGLAAIISGAIFLPVNSGSGGLVWAPVAWPRHFFAEGRITILQWHLKEQVFMAHNNWPHLFVLWGQMTAGFLIVTYGLRMLGILGLWKLRKKMSSEVWIFVVSGLVGATGVGLLFLQQTGVYEIFNFFAVAAVYLCLGLGIWLAQIKLAKVWILLSIVLIIPHSLMYAKDTFKTSVDLTGWHQSFFIDEINFLKRVEIKVGNEEVILTDPGDEREYFSPYISAFTGKRLYLSGLFVLNAHGLKVENRQKEVKEVFENFSTEKLDKYMRGQGIKYALLPISRNVNPSKLQVVEKSTKYILLESK